jgi:hypothetical protein
LGNSNDASATSGNLQAMVDGQDCAVARQSLWSPADPGSAAVFGAPWLQGIVNPPSGFSSLQAPSDTPPIATAHDQTVAGAAGVSASPQTNPVGQAGTMPSGLSQMVDVVNPINGLSVAPAAQLMTSSFDGSDATPVLVGGAVQYHA